MKWTWTLRSRQLDNWSYPTDYRWSDRRCDSQDASLFIIVSCLLPCDWSFSFLLSGGPLTRAYCVAEEERSGEKCESPCPLWGLPWSPTSIAMSYRFPPHLLSYSSFPTDLPLPLILSSSSVHQLQEESTPLKLTLLCHRRVAMLISLKRTAQTEHNAISLVFLQNSQLPWASPATFSGALYSLCKMHWWSPGRWVMTLQSALPPPPCLLPPRSFHV